EGGVERRVLLDGIEEIAEYDAVGAGARVARYDHDVTRVDALLAQVAGVGAGVSKVHLWTDALGSVYGLRDSSGNLQAQYSYDVYGARTGGGETPWGFTGRTADGTTGLQYSRQRYLDSSTGRWTQKDSDSQYTDGFNRYFYVKENPVGRIDPSGTVSAFLTTGGSGEDACEGLSEPSLHPGIATANRDIIITEASGAEVVIRGDILLKDGTVSTNWEAKFTFNDDKFSTIAAFKCKCDSPSQKCAEFRDGLSDRFEENGKAFGLGVATLNFPKVKECNLGKSFAENVASTIFHEWVHFSVFNQTPTKGRVKMSWEGAPSGGYRSIDEWVARAMENRVYGSSTARDYD
ncbi:MAG: RHS repeat-associated core domain-containing protein, partial [Deltaproteobacteria bacterium]|nr:RHS repeat-associated core domain-containing protein [Deltaproteobacteria bacterium]